MNKWLASLSISLLVTASAQTFAAGDPELGKAKAGVCIGCHMMDGNSVNPIWPKLAGQHETYLRKQLGDFKKGEDRSNAMMAPIVLPLTEDDMDNLAAYFASQTQSEGKADPALVDQGEKIFRAGIADKNVSACMACHGPAGYGNPLANFPRISGQHAAYTASTLKAFRAGTRKNDMNGMMQDVVARMTDEEIDAVASYIQGLR